MAGPEHASSTRTRLAPWLADLIVEMGQRLRHIAGLRQMLRDADDPQQAVQLGDNILARVERSILESLKILIDLPPQEHVSTAAMRILTDFVTIMLQKPETCQKNTLPSEEYNTILSDVNMISEGEGQKMAKPTFQVTAISDREIRLKITDFRQYNVVKIETDMGDISVNRCQFDHVEKGQTFPGGRGGKPRKRCMICGSAAWQEGEYQYESPRHIHTHLREAPCPNSA